MPKWSFDVTESGEFTLAGEVCSSLFASPNSKCDNVVYGIVTGEAASKGHKPDDAICVSISHSGILRPGFHV